MTEAAPSRQHEMRTWLSQIIGYSEILLEEAQERGEQGAIPEVRRIREAGLKILALLESEGRPAIQAPTLALEPARAAAPATATDGAVPTDGGLLLVVDDDEANCDLLSRRLAQHRHQVHVARSGPEALALAGAHPFDLILLDMLMPQMDGAQVLQKLKADPQLRPIPVIMLSALSDLDSVVRCIDLGAEDYLPKPVNPVLLRARISACLEKKRLRDLELRHFEELQEKHQQLRELELLRDELVHLLLHDLRTPLTTLVMGLSSIGRRGPLNERQQTVVARSVRGVDTLLRMLNDVLDVSRIEGGVHVSRREVRAEELLEHATEQVLAMAEEQGVALKQEVAPGLPPLHADEELLRRTLVNLLGNALRFTPSGGTVTAAVGRSPDGGGVLFWVRDTGQGIRREHFTRIFEKFGQASLRREGTFVSTGLGLTFCKMAVEAHGGRIWVESELGQGSTFYFVIPQRD